MTAIKLTKTAVDDAQSAAKEYELRDTVVPGFLLKVTPAGRKVFMLQYGATPASGGSPRSAGSASLPWSRRVPWLRTGWPTCAKAGTPAPRKRLPARR